RRKGCAWEAANSSRVISRTSCAYSSILTMDTGLAPPAPGSASLSIPRGPVSGPLGGSARPAPRDVGPAHTGARPPRGGSRDPDLWFVSDAGPLAVGSAPPVRRARARRDVVH